MPVFRFPCSHDVSITQAATFGCLNPPSKASGIAVALFQKGKPCEILFPNKFTGGYLTVSTIEQVMRRSVAIAEIQSKYTPHSFRHSFATHLMENGVEQQNIQELNPIIYNNQKLLYTWGSKMNYHPHIHVIVLGGGSASEYKNHYAFKELIHACYDKEWIPYSKKTFNGTGSVIQYLGKYTHRIAISNYRLIQMNDTTVTFFVKDYKNQGQWKELTLTGIEFIRRFLMHVPPKHFVRIRHYGCHETA